jgi:hypothetical protein
LLAASGPAPWFAPLPPDCDSGTLRWVNPGDSSGCLLLRNDDDAVVLALARYTCAYRIAPSRLLCCSSNANGVTLRLFDSFDVPVGDTSAAVERLQSTGFGVAWESGLAWELRLPVDSAGTISVDFPDVLADVHELLVLASVTFLLGGHARVLLQLRPSHGEIAFYPQDWFNQGDYDFGYQWPTVVAREHHSDCVVGSGFRIGVFELDRSLRNVARWLEEPSAF